MIDIETLTLREIRQLQTALSGIGGAAPSPTPSADPWIGRYVLVRTYSAGVHAGVLVSHDGDQMTLSQARRLWGWQAPQGVALSGVAVSGLTSGRTRVDVTLDEHRLVGVIEVMPCSAKAEASIRGWAVGQ